MPALGLSVPLVGVNGNARLRRGAVLSPPAAQHRDVQLQDTRPGNYNWQCFVPCGLGYLFGNGGGMSTQGYMGGFLEW